LHHAFPVNADNVLSLTSTSILVFMADLPTASPELNRSRRCGKLLPSQPSVVSTIARLPLCGAPFTLVMPGGERAHQRLIAAVVIGLYEADGAHFISLSP